MIYRVYVDAKILGRNDPNLPKRTLVAYKVENSELLQGVRGVDAEETDDAELHAILFAIRELKGRLKQFTIICDHESVVSEANRQPKETPKTNPILKEIREELKANPSIKLKVFAINPAHTLLNQYLEKEKAKSETTKSHR